MLKVKDVHRGRELAREKTKGSEPVGELIWPWSASLYTNKEPSGLPGIYDDSPLGDERGLEVERGQAGGCSSY